MNALFVLASTAFFIWIVRNIVTWTLLWQEKDYNPKRLFYHLKETVRGRNILFSPLSILKWIAVLFFLYSIFEETATILFHIIVIAIYLAQAFFVIKNILKSSGKWPVISSVSIVVIVISLLAVSIIFMYPLIDWYFWLLFIDRSTVLIISFFVFVVSFPLELKSDAEIVRAIKKIKSHKDLMVIGIVGSYAKSSTKEFLYQFLKNDYKIIKTHGHQNTLSEIAHTIIKDLKKSTQIFLVEMNDFSKGDIRKITAVVRPNIGIVTGINPQYLSMFKSYAESVASKNELIDVLPKKSLVLFNGNDTAARKMYDTTKKTKKLYINGLVSNIQELGNKNIYACNEKITKDSISFDAIFGEKRIRIVAPLLGIHNIENLLPVIYLADYLGIKESEIKKIAFTLAPPPNTMIKIKNEVGSIYIDDSSNTNPESIFAALEYMKQYKNKKYVIMQTMIELGKEDQNMHKKIAQKISEQCDMLFVTNKDYINDLEEGVKYNRKKCKVLHLSTVQILNYINQNEKKGDVLLFEGKDSRNVLDRLI